jgi:hypothetical protein
MLTFRSAGPRVSISSKTIEYRIRWSSDFVTILRLASLQYITKLAMSQNQKPRSPRPTKYKAMYPEDAQ